MAADCGAALPLLVVLPLAASFYAYQECVMDPIEWDTQRSKESQSSCNYCSATLVLDHMISSVNELLASQDGLCCCGSKSDGRRMDSNSTQEYVRVVSWSGSDDENFDSRSTDSRESKTQSLL